MDKAYSTKWKENTIHITFINFSSPRIEKDDIIAIKVIGTALNKLILPYIIFGKSPWTLGGCQYFNFIFQNLCFNLSDWIWNKFRHFWSWRCNTFTSIMDCEISLLFRNWLTSKILVLIGKLKQRIYNLRRDLVFSLINFNCKGLQISPVYTDGLDFFSKSSLIVSWCSFGYISVKVISWILFILCFIARLWNFEIKRQYENWEIIKAFLTKCIWKLELEHGFFSQPFCRVD